MRESPFVCMESTISGLLVGRKLPRGLAPIAQQHPGDVQRAVLVILAGVGAVAGIFGMSEAATALAGGEGAGFWVITAGTVLGAAGVATFLRRINWI